MQVVLPCSDDALAWDLDNDLDVDLYDLLTLSLSNKDSLPMDPFDSNNDGVIDSQDEVLWSLAFNQYICSSDPSETTANDDYELNGDGMIDQLDLDIVNDAIGTEYCTCSQAYCPP